MANQEKTESVSDPLKQLEDSLSKDMAKYKEMFELCKKSTQYQLDQKFQAISDSIQGFLADMLKDLEMIKQAKAK